MDKNQALEIIKNSFLHLIFEENVKVCSTEILLYFPSIGIAILEPKENRELIEGNENVEDMDELYIRKELSARPIYLDLNEENFNIGYVINDILIEARFAPADKDFLESRGNN